ncbi:hypothetical protein ACWELB_21060 [Streptomyces asiaticus]
MDEHLSDHRARDAHEVSLIKAAGIAEAYLICHADTWDFIVEECAVGQRSPHFHQPPADAIAVEEGGMVTVPLSGRTVAAVLDQMNEHSLSGATPAVTQAVATAVREAILEMLEGDEGQRPFIIIDSRPRVVGAEEDEQKE